MDWALPNICVDGVQLMKPIPELSQRLADANSHGIFGTKMRSVIKSANSVGIQKIVNQQFEIAAEILDAGLYPIIEPEVDIKAVDKVGCESLLKAELIKHLNQLPQDRPVMLKLTIPTEPNFYQDLIDHPRVLRVVALSGGYSRTEANELLAQNHGLVASFSRALTEGLSAQLTSAEFDESLSRSIESIFKASIT